ncbi:MAG: ATP-binding cassette domain-containing protein [Planctomycetota bacterium]
MLSIRELSKTYGRRGVRALQSITLEIGNGMYGLLGPNGAGKSTLMRTLATLQAPSAGSVELDGVDLLKEPIRARKLIGYLPQDAGVYPRVTAREMLEYLATLRGIATARDRRLAIERQLDRVNLSDVADRRLDTFSGGMRQRFGIATIFLTRPRLVIVDEPTAGLDPTERRRFQCMLAEAAEGCVLLLSSHIVEDVAGLCTRMALLHRGELVLEGDPVSLVRELDGSVWSRRVELPELAAYQERFDLLSWRPEQGRLVLRAHGEALGSEGFERCEPDLEDLYNLHILHSCSGEGLAGTTS